MGVAPYKYFTFDGESSRSYDVYLTGDGVFNAPERAVEMLEIAGRNGNYALDQGKFNNISVTYKAGIVDASESNFADKMSAVRNWLCSKVGYKRLSDDYNANEYRMAVFKSGVTLDHVDLKTGEFEITFDCKPQRWLTSGETAVSVADGGTLNNPTPFEASPLLQVWGYGDLTIGSDTISVANNELGTVVVSPSLTNYEVTFNSSITNTGDAIFPTDYGYWAKQVITYSPATGYEVFYGDITSIHQTYSFSSITLKVGTPKTLTLPCTDPVQVRQIGTSTWLNATHSWTFHFIYDGAGTITVFPTGSSFSGDGAPYISVKSNYSYLYSLSVNSTANATGNPMYIDLDIGEAWNEDFGSVVSANDSVQMPNSLPTLPYGTTTFTYDNTITQFKVVPRWWKV